MESTLKYQTWDESFYIPPDFIPMTFNSRLYWHIAEQSPISQIIGNRARSRLRCSNKLAYISDLTLYGWYCSSTWRQQRGYHCCRNMNKYRTVWMGYKNGRKGKRNASGVLERKDPETWVPRKVQKNIGSLTGRAAWAVDTTWKAQKSVQLVRNSKEQGFIR